MNYYHRHRRRSETRWSSSISRRSSSSRHGTPYDKRCSRQHYLDRHRERSKHKMMEEHRHDAIIDKLGQIEGDNGSREADPWIYLVASTIVVLASLVNASNSLDSTSTYLASLSLCSVQLALVLFGTMYLFRVRFGYLRVNRRRQCRATLILTIFALMLQSGINYLLLGRKDYAMNELLIVNNNMFYGCWVSFGLLSFLLGRGIAFLLYSDEAFFSQRRGSKSQNWRIRHQFVGKMTALWTMYLLFQLCAVSSSLSIRFSPICGGLLGSTTSCTGVMASAILSTFNIILCLLGLFLDKLRIHTSGTTRLYGMLAFLSLLLQSATTGILTSNGGMGCNPGNLYVSTWTNTILIVIICLRCLDGYLVSISPPPEEHKVPFVGKQEKEKKVKTHPMKSQTLVIMSSRSVQRTVSTSSTKVSSDDDGAARRQRILQQQGVQAAPQHRGRTPPLALPALSPPQRFPPPPPRSQRSREPSPTNHRPKADPQGSGSRGYQERVQETAYNHSSKENVNSNSSRKDPDAVTGRAQGTLKRRSSVDNNDTMRRPHSQSRAGRDPSTFYNSIGSAVAKDNEAKPRKSVTEKPPQNARDSSTKLKSTQAVSKDAAVSTERARSTFRQQRDVSYIETAMKEYDSAFKTFLNEKVEQRELNGAEEVAKVDSRVYTSAYSLFESAYECGADTEVMPVKPRRLNKHSSMPSTNQTSKKDLVSKRNKSFSQIDQMQVSDADIFMTVHTNFGNQSSEKSKSSIASIVSEYSDKDAKTSKQTSSNKIDNESSYLSLLFDDDEGTRDEGSTPSGKKPSNGSNIKRNNSTLTQHIESPTNGNPSSAEFGGVVAAALAAAKSTRSSPEPAEQQGLPIEEEVSDYEPKEHPLDFQYRPMSSAHNFNSTMSRRRFADEVSHYLQPQEAPVQTIETTDSNSNDVSEPTIDRSIRTTKTSKPRTDSNAIDANIQAALNRANEVRRSRRLGESLGKITVQGLGEAEDVNEIVAAALQAASSKVSKPRRRVKSTNSMHEPPPPPHVAARRLDSVHALMPPPPLDCRRKKSASSNFSDIMNQVFSDGFYSQIEKKMNDRENENEDHHRPKIPRRENQSGNSFYSKSNSRASSESFAMC